MAKPLALVLQIILAAPLAFALSAPLAAQKITAFYGVTVVDVADGTLRPSHTVIVRDGKIDVVAPALITEIPKGATRIEAIRKFLIPGLIELDGVLQTSTDDFGADDVLDVYKSHGVTTLRAPLTDPKQEDLRRRSERGDDQRPRVLLGPAPTGQARSTKDLWRSTSIPTRPSGLTPAETLKAITIDAAEELGLADVGVIRVGARADLVLLSANPLEGLQALATIEGVMILGRMDPPKDLSEDMEDHAKDAVLGYYRTLPRRGFTVPSCHGESLAECYGGDVECTIAFNCTSEALRAKREELLDELDRYGAAGWRSNWIVGQRVSFAVKNGDFARAIAAADSCGGTYWWCLALRGYARHRALLGSGDAQLDSAIAFVVPSVPAWALPKFPSSGDRGVTCEWRDVSTLLTRRMRDQYEREKTLCVETPFDARFWFLSDPLWSVPGNERKSEHYARNIEARLHDEILRLRMGAHRIEAHWKLLPAGLGNSWDPLPGRPGSTTGSEPRPGPAFVNGGYSFTPDDDRFYDPVSSTSEDWLLEWNQGREVMQTGVPITGATHIPDERMVTAERWFNLEHQTAVLRRGPQLLVMEAGTLPLAIQRPAVTFAKLALGRPIDSRIVVTNARVDTAGNLRASMPVDAPTPARAALFSPNDVEWMTSLEVVAPGLRARAREGAKAPLVTDGFGVSDVVLVRDDFETSRATLLDAMLPSTSISKAQPIGIYFEIYGVSAGERLQFAVATAPTNLSLAQRLAGALRMRSEDGLDVSWLEAAETPTPGTMTRFVKLELANLQDGDHEILVTVTRANDTAASASRLVRIVP